MASLKGLSDVQRHIRQLPAKVEKKVLRGAARAAGKVVMDEAGARVTSEEVREGLTMNTQSEPGRVVVKITVKSGWARSVANWLEYGTDPHFISVSDADRQGMSVRRVNERTKAGTLVIGGQPVGGTVHHPGARPHPFLRVSLDLKEADAIAAAQSFINSRVGPGGITGESEPEGADA